VEGHLLILLLKPIVQTYSRLKQLVADNRKLGLQPILDDMMTSAYTAICFSTTAHSTAAYSYNSTPNT